MSQNEVKGRHGGVRLIVKGPVCDACGHARLDEHRPLPERGCKLCDCPLGGTYLRLKKDGSYFECRTSLWNQKPLPRGHTYTVTHGARSPKIVEARANQILEALVERIPMLGTLDREQVLRYCEVRAKEHLYGEYIDAIIFGEKDFKGECGVGAVPDTVIQAYIRLATLGQKICQDLGMDPTGYAKLAKDFGLAKRLHDTRMDELAARGRSLRRGQAID